MGAPLLTDAINAGALSGLGTSAQNTVTAAAAGMDLIVEATRDVSAGQAVVDGLASALESGDLDGGDFQAVLGRIVDLRACLS